VTAPLPPRIILLATGSRGDVQPFVALAYALAQAGQPVTLVANACYTAWVRSYGLELCGIDWDPTQALRAQPDWSRLPLWQFPTAARRLQASLQDVYTRAQRGSWEAITALSAASRPLLVFSLLAPWGYSLAEKLGLPVIAGALHPFTPTRCFPTQMVLKNLGGPLNLLSHALAEQALQLISGGEINRFRRQALDLPPVRFPHTLPGLLRQQRTPLLCSLSPTIIPRPSDWPDYVQMSGYWFLPPAPGWQPPPELTHFLESGPPPIYLGFGSMIFPHPEQTLRACLAAFVAAGLRAVVSGGWGALPASSERDQVLALPGGPAQPDLPHDWLFPRLAAVVHHGGAGTTAAALRAGVPQVVVPYMQDQFYWAQRVQQLGVGPAPLPHARLSAAALVERLRQAVQSPAIRARAQTLGAVIDQEHGVESAAAFIQSWLAANPAV
jgi:UDP:flavonoid glycosyltransferase YjiC (YdhE family)